ncbi:MAG TPA: citrate/2-methylcitrate synthase [Polyangiaceae bacterium]|jgi:citrate synthase|nr:citrate/2-methylcitrate synthase [Polyangiaceae bacterium]
MTRKPKAWLSSRKASERLGVKLATLYAYTSRGLIASVASESGRGHVYAADDIERLRTRHAARSGHAAVAASALRFGEPVLETRISQVTNGKLYYRGHSAIELCRSDVGFERVAELLWGGALPDAAHAAKLPARPLKFERARLGPLLKSRATLAKMSLILAALALSDGDRHGASDLAEHARARAVTRLLATACAPRAIKISNQPRIATILLDALGVTATRANVLGVDRALVLSAEHELNASTFAARVAASTGADLYACLGAAVNTLSGGAHGGMCDRVEAFIDAIGAKQHAARAVRERLARGEQIPGFGHPLYPEGDPRGALLVELAERHGARSEAARTALALIEAMSAGGHPAVTLDGGLVALCDCLELPRGAAATIFALGRNAGWIAHILEQRADGYLLRPRARYVGEAPIEK